MSEIRVDSIGNESNTGGPVLSGVTEFSGQQYFIPPSGTTAERPSDCPSGSIRFNTDSAHLEYWNGLVWLEFEASSNELGGPLEGYMLQMESPPVEQELVVLFAGGYAPAHTNVIKYFTIPTLGNTQDFGTMVKRQVKCGCISNTRGIFAGGRTRRLTPSN